MTHDPSGLPSQSTGRPQPSSAGPFPDNWKEAILCLIASRIGIMRIETKDALEVAVRKLAILGVAIFCLIATWGLLTAGLIGLISAHFKCEWYFAAFSLGGGYLLITLVMLMVIKNSKKADPFPITRAEFEKDREWLNQLKNRSSSQS